MDDIENGMILDNDEYDTVSQEAYDYYWQDDFRKEAEIQAAIQELKTK